MPSSPWPPKYPSLAEHWQARFHERVQRVSLDAGFSCPNRDGAAGREGCVFCDPVTFSPAAGDRRPVSVQLATRMTSLRQRGVTKFAAYFQPHTNTYAPLPVLREIWDEVLLFPEVVALCVGTRPDCVPDPVLDLLSSYRDRLEVWLELGLQSAHDGTLRRLNRAHTAGDFADACRRARARRFQVCAHVILGLPDEAAADETYTAGFLSDLGVEGVKLHQLAVVRGTALETAWRRGAVQVLTEEEYVERAVAFVRRLPPNAVLHRLVGDTRAERLLAPRYNKGRVVDAIRRGIRGS
jgi:radical SAM protein (TIGR01212 family)